MNKQQVQKIIDHFADKTLSFGCRVSGFSKYREPENGEKKEKLGTVIMHDSIRAPNSMEILWDGNATIAPVVFLKDIDVLGHPVMIGDALEKADKQLTEKRKNSEEIYCQCDCDDFGVQHELDVITFLWRPCGFTNSLKKIVENSGWEKKCGFCKKGDSLEKVLDCRKVHHTYWEERLKDKNARALFELLDTILTK
jgi:hypothetical protein